MFRVSESDSGLMMSVLSFQISFSCASRVRLIFYVSLYLWTKEKKRDKILSYTKVATIIWLKYNRFSHTYFSYYPTCFTNNIFFDVGDAGLRDTVVLKTRYVLFSGRLTISSHIIFSDLTIKAADISTSTHRNNMGLHAVLAAEIARCAYSHGSNTSNLYWEYSPTVCHICTIAKESQMRTGIK